MLDNKPATKSLPCVTVTVWLLSQNTLVSGIVTSKLAAVILDGNAELISQFTSILKVLSAFFVTTVFTLIDIILYNSII